jgi:RNA polymerase sigma-70 factor, ECF subfamily
VELSGLFSQDGAVTALRPALVESEPPDLRSLLALARGGDAEAFSQVYRAVATRLLRQALALCGNVSQAEEMTQDTLVEAWRHLPRYNGRCQFFTWLCAILLHRYHNSLRDKTLQPWSALGRQAREEFAQALESLPDPASLPDEAAELRERNALVRQCIDSLPAKQQQVIYLRFYVDDSLEGIAAALGCSVGTVKSRLFHALEKLRRMNALNAPPRDSTIRSRAL